MKTSFWVHVVSIVLGVAASACAPKLAACDCGGPVVQLGWFTANQGKSQHVDIEGLIGDDFSVDKSWDQNVLVGLGYYFDGFDFCQAHIVYGVNAFYFAPARVSGKVTQEDLFTNLSYHYSRTNCPIYFAAKAVIPCWSCYDLTIDAGIGPNIISTGSFKERSLDGGITTPDTNMFSRKTGVAFSATAGAGWRINDVWDNLALEIDYRFFYLGQGKLKKGSSQVQNSLSTGHSYANAIFVSVSM